MKKHLLFAVAFFLTICTNAQWLEQNAGFSANPLGFYEMSIVNRHTAWAICYDGVNGLFSNRTILDFTRTKNGGNTWIPGKMGNDSSLQFSNISAISEKEAWVAMHKLNGITGGGLYHTKNGGVTWTQSNAGQIFDANSFPDFVHFKNKNKGIAVGDPNNGYFEIYTTNNGGNNWHRVTASHIPAMLPNEYGWISGYAALGNTIWFGTTSGRMYKSTNFGKDWTVNTVDPAGNAIYEIAFNDDKLHGVTHMRSNAGTFLFSTADGGVTWTNLGQPANWKSSRITAVPGTNALVSTSVVLSDPGSAVSYDNGATWIAIDNTVHKAVARFYDAQTGWAGGFFSVGPPFSGGIYKSQIVFQVPSCHDRINPVEKNGGMKPLVIPPTPTDKQINIYPTPANDVINIVLPDELANTKSMISIFSIDGNLITTGKSTATKFIRLDVSKLTAGVYLLRIEANGQKINKMITIAR